MSDVLVTGGAGFIGSNLVKRLLKDGHNVSVIDSMHTGAKPNLCDVYDLLTEFHEWQVSVGIKFLKVEPEVIFHLGIASSSPMYRNDPSRMASAIWDWTRLLEYVAKLRKNKTVYNNPKIVWASSSSVYNGNPVPWKESMPIQVKDLYTETRYAMERLGKLYYVTKDVRNVPMRFFSVYGPHEEYKGCYANMLTQFIWKLIRREQPVIFGDGSQYRDFIYVDDVVEALMTAAFRPYPNNVDNGPLNVGTGDSYSFNTIYKIIQLALDYTSNIKPKYVPNPLTNYVHGTMADIELINHTLWWDRNPELPTHLMDGIKKTIQYYTSLPIDSIPEV